MKSHIGFEIVGKTERQDGQTYFYFYVWMAIQILFTFLVGKNIISESQKKLSQKKTS